MTGKILVTALSLLILQAGVGPLITVGNARPSFLLPFVVYVSLQSGSLLGTMVGFLLGLGVDALGNLPLGMSALAFSITGFFAGKLAKDAPFRLWWPWTAYVLLFAFVLEFLRMLVLARANQLPFLNLMLWSGIPSALWTTGLAVLWFLSPLHKRDGSA
ncbi:MAG: rod shape-determining protein MreD [Calditrichaeota bacterium]|nr:rod shape-determining protein MreD [Calditrichota bacterium]MCB9368692.1 rod shape-determining protein MreD [Calditrichota bacterium]